MVTAAAKMRHGTKMSLTYAGTINECICFWRDPEIRRSQYEATEVLLSALGPPLPQVGRFHQWQGVAPGDVLVWLQKLRVHPNARRVVPRFLAEYIELCNTHGELVEWTLSLHSNQSDKQPATFAGLEIGRNERDDDGGDRDAYRIKRMLSPKHEQADLSVNENPDGNTISDTKSRDKRPVTRGHLLLYLLKPEDNGIPYISFGFSFPGLSNAGEIEYVVNNVYVQEELAL